MSWTGSSARTPLIHAELTCFGAPGTARAPATPGCGRRPPCTPLRARVPCLSGEGEESVPRSFLRQASRRRPKKLTWDVRPLSSAPRPIYKLVRRGDFAFGLLRLQASQLLARLNARPLGSVGAAGHGSGHLVACGVQLALLRSRGRGRQEFAARRRSCGSGVRRVGRRPL